MRKMKVLASFLVASMVVSTIPNLGLTSVKAAIESNVVISADVVTGILGDAATTKRAIVPENATKITANAFSNDYLEEISIRNDNIVIEDHAFGYDSKNAVKNGFVVWCNPGSTAEKYAKANSLVVKYFNTKDLSIGCGTSDVRYSGCKSFVVTSTGSEGAEDFIWTLSGSAAEKGLVWFEVDGKKVNEISGAMTANADKTVTSEAKIYVAETTLMTDLESKFTVKVDCRGTGAASEKEMTIKKATSKMDVNYVVFEPCRDVENGNRIIVEETSAECTYNIVARPIDSGKLSDEQLKVYAAEGDLIYLVADIEEDCLDKLGMSLTNNSGAHFASDYMMANMLYNRSDEKGNVKKLDVISGSDILLNAIVDDNGKILLSNANDLIYVADKNNTKPEVTFISSNNVLTKKVGIEVTEVPSKIELTMNGAIVKSGYYGLYVEGSSYILKFNVNPNSILYNATWESSDATVAQVTGDKLNILSPGEAKLKCKITDKENSKRGFEINYYLNATVIKKVPYSGIVFTEDATQKTQITDLYVEEGKTEQLFISDYKNGAIYIAGNDETAANEQLIYKSTDENIVKVDEKGVVKGNAVGTTTVKVYSTTNQQINGVINVHVYTKATAININSATTAVVGQQSLVDYELVPVTSTEEVVWSCENEAIASVEDYTDENGKRFLKIIGKSAGSCDVIGTTIPTKARKIVKLTVEKPIHADSVELSYTGDKVTEDKNASELTYNLVKGSTMSIVPVLKNTAGLKVNDACTWFIEKDQKIGTVAVDADGTLKITGLSIGQFAPVLNVVGYNEDGTKVEKKVKVNVKVYSPATAVVINNNLDKVEIELGGKIDLTAKITPNECVEKITWSTDSDAITVLLDETNNNEKNTIFANKTGLATVKVTTESGYTDTILVNVYKSAKEVKFINDGKQITRLYVPAGEVKTVNIDINDEDTTDTSFTWTLSTGKGYYEIVPSADGKKATITGRVPSKDVYKVSVKGNSSDAGNTYNLEVVVVSPATAISIGEENRTMYKGQSIPINATLTPSDCTDVIEWSVDNDKVVTINTKNIFEPTIKAVGVGTAVVTAKTSSGKTATVTITVIARDLEGDNVTIKVDNCESVDGISSCTKVYTGAPIIPSNVSISAIEDEKNVNITNQFDVRYENNVKVGQAKVIITAKEDSNYSGETSVEFTINPKSISSVSVELKNPDDIMVYGGEAFKPEIVVKDTLVSDTPLVEDVDYTLSYEKNVNSGTGEIIVNGIGNYTNKTQKKFTITKKDITDASDIVADKTTINNFTYTGNSYEQSKLVVKYGTKIMEKGVDYSVSYVNASTNMTISPKDAGKYIIRISGKGVNFTGTKDVATFTIARKSLTAAKVTGLANMKFTGSEIKIRPTVILSNKNLSMASDFSVKYYSSDSNKCIKPGQVKVVISGIKNYSGSITKYYVIYPGVSQKGAMATCTTNSAKVSWSKVVGASGYYVYVASGNSSSYKKVGTTTTNNFVIKNLSAGSDYKVRIYAYVKVGTKNYFDNTRMLDISSVGTKTSNPVISKYSSISKGMSITVKSLKGATKYNYYYSTSKNGKYKLANSTGSSTITINGLVGGKTYYVKVNAERTINGKTYKSGFSAIKAVKTRK